MYSITLISRGVPPLEGVKQWCGGKKTNYFRTKCVNISTMVGDTRMLLYND